MFLVSEIWEEGKSTFGHCYEPKLFRQITDSIELLATSGDIDPLFGEVDLCVDGGCVTLPRIVQTVLAVNICGKPATPRDQLFSYHINGSGDRGCGCSWSWQDKGNWPTYKDLRCPSKLVAFLDSPEDAGKLVRVFGFDEMNRPLRTQTGTGWEEGLRVMTSYGYALPASNDPLVSRITGVVKDVTVADVRLSSFDSSSTTGTLLGVFEPDETLPLYRRIKICPSGQWVRVAYRKNTYEIRSINDRILLHSRPALLLAMRAYKYYTDGDIQNGNLFEANSVRLLTQKEWCLGSPAGLPIQVLTGGSISAKCDYLD